MDKNTKNVRRGVWIFLSLALVFSVFILTGNRYGYPDPGAWAHALVLRAGNGLHEAVGDLTGLALGGGDGAQGEGGASDGGNGAAKDSDGGSEGEDGASGQSGASDGWYYLDGGDDPGNGTVWTTVRYKPKQWKTAPDPFYAAGSGSGTGLVSADENGEYAHTYFFRREFEAKDPDHVEGIAGTIRYCDAVIVYLNGKVIFAGNVPPGGYDNSMETGCSVSSEKVHEESFLVTDPSVLEEGTNVLAVELHQSDPSKEKAYFSFPYFNLISEETDDSAPRTQNIFLELGKDEEQVYVNYLSDEETCLEVGYMTESEYRRYLEGWKDWDPFSIGADYVLMGRTYDEERGCYVYRAPVTLLRKNEKYLYRIRHVGGSEETETKQFDFSSSLSYTFTVFGSGISGEDAKTYLDKAASQAEEFSAERAAEQKDGWFGNLLSGQDAGPDTGETFIAAERQFMDGGPEIGAEIPVCILGEEGSRSFTYYDVLFLVPDPSDEDREEFIRMEKEKTRRRWTVVLLDEPSDESGENPYADLGVDLTVNATEQDILLVRVTDRELEVRKAGP